MNDADVERPQMLSDREVDDLVIIVVESSDEPLERDEVVRRSNILLEWAEDTRFNAALLRLVLHKRMNVFFDGDELKFAPPIAAREADKP